MAYTIEVHLDVDVDPEVAFDALADHDAWAAWMPRSFVPAGPGLGRLSVGARPRVRIDRLPFATPLRVTVAERPRELTWTGGNALLHAEHRFLFERTARGTRITSSETWSGPLASLAAPVVRRAASRVGRETLEGLANGAKARAARATA